MFNVNSSQRDEHTVKTKQTRRECQGRKHDFLISFVHGHSRVVKEDFGKVQCIGHERDVVEHKLKTRSNTPSDFTADAYVTWQTCSHYK